MRLIWLIRSQTIVTLASGMVYPYYLLFLKNLGNSYAKYGLAFAVFTVSSAAVSGWLGSRLDRHGPRLLLAGSLGMMLVMLAFPWVQSFMAVLALQLAMGVCSAMQKMSERSLLADYTVQGARGGAIGSHQFWTSAASGFAVILGGYLMDWLTINALFYVSALLYGLSAWAVWRSLVRD
ncbi:Major Facilitator Superfamily protein [Paenibacillus sp. UNCCL117]|uniref:MFS transporter n=1 Tax=unclassified Paenibacillus TaxID=185978 RepID=UPI00088C994E|nr:MULTISPECIES: MFS transporter [unclassified Paenibacillus]SDE41224.1 Major Facilitator Superfamily protein [Paenibacillus sp. cl123]SFW65451.1 Major Facilitator Superfamily protein [Paenibacillus sp. UNCCL117]